MILRDGTVIDHGTIGHKFASPLAQFLWLGLNEWGDADEQTGDVDWLYHVARHGRRLCFSDTQGFVWVERFAREADAMREFSMIDREYREAIGES